MRALRVGILLALWSAGLGAQVRPVAGSGPSPPSPASMPWSFREDFRHGIPNWASYPLAQDQGYDPSLYTATGNGPARLVRDVIAEGQQYLRIGLLRPLQFRATPLSSFFLEYTTEFTGPITRAEFWLAGTDGKRYRAALPGTSGRQRVQLQGKRLGIPTGGIEVEGLVIEFCVARPSLGSHNRLLLQEVAIDAERVPEVALARPRLIRSRAADYLVAAEPVTPKASLHLELAPGASSADVLLYDPSGKLLETLKLAPANSVVLPFESLLTDHPGLWRTQVRSAAGITRFRFLVLDRVPEHPRTLLSAARLDQLRAELSSNEILRLVHHLAPQMARSIAYDAAAGDNITRMSVVSVFPGLVPYFDLMETYSNAIAFNALDFCLTGNNESLAAARRGLLAVAQWSTWTPPWFAAHGLNTYYEVGIFTARVAFAYDLLADQFTVAEKGRIADALMQKSIRPTLEEYFFSHRLPIATSNHMAHSVGGAIAACLAVYGDVPDWESRFAPALAQLLVSYEELLRGLFPGDGSEAEPAGYQSFAMQGLTWATAALDQAGMRPAGTDSMLQSFWWQQYMQVSADIGLDTGDFDGRLGALSGLAWGAEYAGDPAPRAYYQTATDRSLLGLSRLHDTGRDLERAPGLLDLVCCTRAASPAPVLPPPSRIFPGRGSAVLRSGWGPQDTAISIRVGPWFNHEHHDQGSFQVAAFGEKLIGEAGYASYYKEPRYQDYFTQAAGHNTVLLDDDPFSQHSFESPFWRAFDQYPRFTRHMLSSEMDYLAADLAPAYDGGLRKYTRAYLFIKPDILIVRDQLLAAALHRYVWLLHAPPGARARAQGSSAIIEGKAAVVLVTAGQNARWSVQASPVSILPYEDFDRERIPDQQVLRLESKELRTHGSFLAGLRFTNSAQGSDPLRWVETANGQGFTASTSRGKLTAIFRVQPGPLSAGEMSTDGDALVVIEEGDARRMFADRATRLQRGREVLVASTAPMELGLLRGSRQDEVQLSTTRAITLKIVVSGRDNRVTLDGKSVNANADGKYVSLQVAEGEHSVSIRY